MITPQQCFYSIQNLTTPSLTLRTDEAHTFEGTYSKVDVILTLSVEYAGLLCHHLLSEKKCFWMHQAVPGCGHREMSH